MTPAAGATPHPPAFGTAGRWIGLNAVRLVLLVVLLWSALLALGRFGDGPRDAAA